MTDSDEEVYLFYFLFHPINISKSTKSSKLNSLQDYSNIRNLFETKMKLMEVIWRINLPVKSNEPLDIMFVLKVKNESVKR